MADARAQRGGQHAHPGVLLPRRGGAGFHSHAVLPRHAGLHHAEQPREGDRFLGRRAPAGCARHADGGAAAVAGAPRPVSRPAASRGGRLRGPGARALPAAARVGAAHLHPGPGADGAEDRHRDRPGAAVRRIRRLAAAPHARALRLRRPRPVRCGRADGAERALLHDVRAGHRPVQPRRPSLQDRRARPPLPRAGGGRHPPPLCRARTLAARTRGQLRAPRRRTPAPGVHPRGHARRHLGMERADRGDDLQRALGGDARLSPRRARTAVDRHLAALRPPGRPRRLGCRGAPSPARRDAVLRARDPHAPPRRALDPRAGSRRAAHPHRRRRAGMDVRHAYRHHRPLPRRAGARRGAEAPASALGERARRALRVSRGRRRQGELPLRRPPDRGADRLPRRRGGA